MKLHIIDLSRLDKNSFTIFETLISIILLSIIIVGFSKYSYYDNFDEEFMLLNEIENSFTTKTFNSNFSTSTKNIKVIRNGIQEDTISVKEIKYNDNKIELIKYEVQ